MYEDYLKLREALHQFIYGSLTVEEAEEILDYTEYPESKEEFYLNTWLDTEPDNIKLAVIQSLTGNAPGTATDHDRNIEILKTINDIKWQL